MSSDHFERQNEGWAVSPGPQLINSATATTREAKPACVTVATQLLGAAAAAVAGAPGTVGAVVVGFGVVVAAATLVGVAGSAVDGVPRIGWPTICAPLAHL